MRQSYFLVFDISPSGFRRGGRGSSKFPIPVLRKSDQKIFGYRKNVMPPEAVDQSEAG